MNAVQSLSVGIARQDAAVLHYLEENLKVYRCTEAGGFNGLASGGGGMGIV